MARFSVPTPSTGVPEFHSREVTAPLAAYRLWPDLMLPSICGLLHTHRMLMTPFHMLMSARAHTATADCWAAPRARPRALVNDRQIARSRTAGMTAWDRGRGAVLDPALPRPGASPP